MSIAAFIIALLLLGGSIDPTRGWLITMVVLTGVAGMCAGGHCSLHDGKDEIAYSQGGSAAAPQYLYS